MLKNKLSLKNKMLIIVMSLILILLNFNNIISIKPITVYKVYVDGSVVGTIESKKSFEDYVNSQEEKAKKKFNVDKIYAPSGVEIKKVKTYLKLKDSNKKVYQKITKEKQFTIKGTIITIKENSDDEIDKEEQEEDKIIYTTKKSIFDEALIKLIKSFVDEEDYDSYMDGTQEEIDDLGSIIDDVDINQEITYKSGYISIDEDIYTSSDDLAIYMTYGTTDEQETYIVQENDTIESIANSHKLNVQEFLIANKNFSSKNNLLYTGEVVKVGLIKPIIEIKVTKTSIEEEERAFGVTVEYDANEPKGNEYVSQEGENGLYKVKKKYEYINGQLAEAVTISSTELKAPVNKVVVKGDKYVPEVADLSYWAWPTTTPYTITTYYGYRWGSMHAAIDIYVGYNSPIYAANNGTVIAATGGCTPGYTRCNGGRGNFVVINHNNGNYYTMYMHLNSILVTQGQTVERGQKIATMGNTGDCYPVPTSSNPYGGTHLHFATSKGSPLSGGSPFNPLTLY